jgi:hypothetical protein
MLEFDNVLPFFESGFVYGLSMLTEGFFSLIKFQLQDVDLDLNVVLAIDFKSSSPLMDFFRLLT